MIKGSKNKYIFHRMLEMVWALMLAKESHGEAPTTNICKDGKGCREDQAGKLLPWVEDVSETPGQTRGTWRRKPLEPAWSACVHGFHDKRVFANMHFCKSRE